MQGTEHGLLIPRITESRRSVRDGMRFQELSSASSALNQVGVTGIPPLQGTHMIVCEKCVTGGFVIASMLSSFYGWELFNFHQQFRVSAK